MRILITGASSGLGEGLALVYAAPGVTLGLVGRRGETLARVAARVEALGARAKVYMADVCNTDRMSEVIEDFRTSAGRLDVVIANAGIGESTSDQERSSAKSAAQVFSTNLIGLSNTLLPAFASMREQGHGTLVGMASVAGYRALPGSVVYSTSKAGVMTFLEGLQMESRGSGVHVVTLCPGFVRTPLTDLNEFSMPFLLPCDEACRRMKRAIEKKRSRFTFPFPMAILAQLMRLSPQWLLVRSSPRSTSR